jgi:uncharacterized repeat protein (TIGR04076 family)
MANDPGIGSKITARVTAIKGACDAGHRIGDSFEISCFNTGGLCGFFYHALYPDLQTFQFGGKLPWWEGDVLEVVCPDRGNQITVLLERSERPQPLE